MKTFLLVLILLAFLQSAFLPLNLVLVALIARSLVVDDKSNLLLAFLGGLILSFLTQVNLGYWPLVFLLIVKIAGLLKKLPISFNLLMILLYGSLLVGLTALLSRFFIGENWGLLTYIIEAVLVFPSYFLVKFWEERFIVKSHIKLKV